LHRALSHLTSCLFVLRLVWLLWLTISVVASGSTNDFGAKRTKNGLKKQKTRWAVAPAGDENLVLANRYTHLIKRGAVP
jgi:hypothetical protein